MPPIPLRMLFRNRWAALAWAVGICVGAVGFVGDQGGASVDAAKSADGNAAQVSALLAEEAD